MKSKAVLMMAYGGPGSLEDVEPYLLDVRGGRATPPELVQEIRTRYAAIGGKSPLLEITQAQASALEHVLNNGSHEDTYRVFVGMRHWFPYIKEAISQILHAGCQGVIAICMTPYFSKMSTQAYFDQLDQSMQMFENEGLVIPPVVKISAWHTNPLFIQASAEKLEKGIRQFPAVLQAGGKIVFTAHSLPAVAIQQGDPYEQQFCATARAVAERLKLPKAQWELCYQSAGARNTPWLGPSVEETLASLAQAQVKNVLVAPIGFLSDQLEILFDIDIAAKRQAEAAGIHLERTEALNTSPCFIAALAQIIKPGGME